MKAKYVRVRSPKGSPNIVHKYTTPEVILPLNAGTSRDTDAYELATGEMPLETITRNMKISNVVDGIAYMVGGNNSTGPGRYEGTVRKIDFTTGKITMVGEYESMIARYASIILKDNKLYVMGFYESSVNSTVRIVDLATMDVDSTSIVLPALLYNFGACIHGDNLYIFGGSGTSVISKVIYIYNFVTSTWTTSSFTLTSYRNKPGCHPVTIDGVTYIYVVGGNADGIEVFTLTDGAITAKNVYNIYYGGGNSYYTPSAVIGTDIYVYSMYNSGIWSYGNYMLCKINCLTNTIDTFSLPGNYRDKVTYQSRMGGVVASYNDKLYSFGGYNRCVMEVFDPVTTKWSIMNHDEYPHFNNGFLETTSNYEDSGSMNKYQPYGKAFAINNIGYIAGGLKSDSTMDNLTGVWAPVKDTNVTRLDSATESLGGYGYVIGGRSSNYTSSWLKSVERYDSITDTWTYITDMNIARTSFSTFILDGKIYACGGVSSSVVAMSNVERYDPVTNTWMTVASMNVARHNSSAVVYQNKGYVTGGNVSGVVTLTTEYYDPATNTWSAGFNLPEARGKHKIINLNGVLYLIGGENPYIALTTFAYVNGEWVSKAAIPMYMRGGNICVRNGYIYSLVDDGTLYKYDPILNIWSTEAISSRCYLTGTEIMFLLDGSFYALGKDAYTVVQKFTPVTGFKYSNLIQKFNPVTKLWSAEPVLTTARTSHATEVINGKAYFFGGVGENGPLNTIECFDPTLNTSVLVSATLDKALYGMGSCTYNGSIFLAGGIYEVDGEKKYNDGIYKYDTTTNTLTKLDAVIDPTIITEMVNTGKLVEYTAYAHRIVVNSANKKAYIHSTVSSTVAVLNLETLTAEVMSRMDSTLIGQYTTLLYLDNIPTLFGMDSGTCMFMSPYGSSISYSSSFNDMRIFGSGAFILNNGSSDFLYVFNDQHMYTLDISKLKESGRYPVYTYPGNHEDKLKLNYNSVITAKKLDVAADKAAVEAIVNIDYNMYVDPLVPSEIIDLSTLTSVGGIRGPWTITEKTNIATETPPSGVIARISETGFKAYDIKVSSSTMSIINFNNATYRGLVNTSEC